MEVREVLRTSPNHFLAHDLNALIKYQRQDIDGAAVVLRRVLGIAPDHAPSLYMAGTASLGLGQSAQATEILQRAVELAPDAAPFRNQLALGFLSAGDDERAVVELESAIAVDGSQFQSELLLTMLRMKEGDYSAAVQASRAIIEKNAASPFRYNLKGAALLGKSDIAGARAAFERALQVDAAFLPAARNLDRLDRAEVDRAVAKQRFESVLTANPDEIGALLELAELAAAEQQLAEAARPEAVLLKADVLLAEGDEEGAYLNCQALADAGIREGVICIVVLRQQQGSFEEALIGLDEWIQSNAYDVGAKMLRADALMRLSDKTAAIAQYEQLLSADNPAVLNNLAWLYMEQGDQRALSTARRALELATDNPDILDTLGWALV